MCKMMYFQCCIGSIHTAPTIKNDPAVLAAATNPNHRNEALNKLLLNVDNTNNNNNNLQPGDQKVKIKVAFAEGYLAANNSAVGKTGVATKFLKVSCILTISIAIGSAFNAIDFHFRCS